MSLRLPDKLRERKSHKHTSSASLSADFGLHDPHLVSGTLTIFSQGQPCYLKPDSLQAASRFSCQQQRAAFPQGITGSSLKTLVAKKLEDDWDGDGAKLVIEDPRKGGVEVPEFVLVHYP